jgi:diguanylate cyclase (GGDEF)-like protein
MIRRRMDRTDNRHMLIHMRKLASLCALLVCLAAGAGAQRFSFRNYTDGLNNLNVSTMLQDRTGFLWVGTQNGLYRYDGSRFVEYGPQQGLRDTYVVTLYLDESGQLWVATMGGLYHLRADGDFGVVRYRGSSLTFSPGSKLASDGATALLAASRGGLFRIEKVRGGDDGWEARPVQTESDDNSAQYVSSLLADSDGSVWFGCGSNLCHKVGTTVTRWGAEAGVPLEQWTDLMRDSQGQIWMRSDDHLGVFDARKLRYTSRDAPELTAGGGTYLPPVEDRKGRIVSGGGMQLARYENGAWKLFGAAQGLNRMNVSAVMVDKEGSVWIGLFGHGLQKWLGQDQWEAWTTAEGLKNDIVWAITRDTQGRLWVGTEGGISYMPEGSKELRPWPATGIDASRTLTLAESRDGYLWAGTAGGKLIRIDMATLGARQYDYPLVRKVMVDSVNRVWVATDHGLYLGTGSGVARSFRLVDNPDLTRDHVGDVREGADGAIWTASDRALYRYDTMGWHRIQFDFQRAGISRVDEVSPSPQGDVLLEGSFTGIVSLQVSDYKVTHVETLTKPTLLSDAVDFINFDERGWLWVGQDRGVSVYDGRAWRKFTQDSGLVWNDCSQDAFFVDRNGSVWIGTAGGLAHLNNPLATSRGAPPRPIFVSATLGNKPVVDGARFHWSREALTIGMASLTFRDVGAIRFRYRLLGVDPDWVQVRVREARYPQLPPGSYRFQAVAVDAASNTESDMEELSFEIVPPWWQTTTFYAIAGVLLVTACVLAWRRRVKQLLERQQELETAVAERTQELEAEKAELVHTREKLKMLAAHDGLTGLWNRRTILEHLEGELARARREDSSVAVIMADVDHFKRINDVFGHLTGDAVLREVAERFAAAMRSYDQVGRYGGEEFLIVLPHCDLEIAMRRAEDLRHSLAARKFVAGISRLDVSSSFGVAVSEGGMVSAEAVVRAADSALYFAKQQGRNRVETRAGATVATRS